MKNIYLFLFFNVVYGNGILEYKTDLFSISKTPTEKEVYLQVKSYLFHNSLFFTYVAIPWAIIINQNKINELPKNIFLNNGVTVCQHIFYKKLIPYMKKIGIKILFCPHATESDSDSEILVLPFPHYAVNVVKSKKDKDIFYSFIGCKNTHKIRKIFLNMKHSDDCYVKERIYWHWSRDNLLPNCTTIEEQKEYQREYLEILSRSIFSICLRGSGPSTIRFWESLGSQSIPVLVGDDMWLPKNFNWKSCVVFIKNSELKNLNHILRSYSKDKIAKMQKNCLKAYSKFSYQHFLSLILCDVQSYMDSIL